MEMQQTEKEAIRVASEEVSCEFKTLINPHDLDSLKQLQHLIFISLSLSLLDKMLFMWSALIKVE